jgi:nucleoside-diphosphate-sugar epimerase
MARKRLLVVGCGDVARRALPQWLERYDVAALVRAPDPALAARGVRLFPGDLDQPETLGSLAGAAELIVHAAPPSETGPQDMRTRNLLAALTQSQNGRSQKGGAMLPQRVVYISTSGVYGDCGGDYVEESRPVNPQTDRAGRRVDAEAVLSRWCGDRGIALVILRVPGIYAADRLPLVQLRRGTPVLAAEDDVYTNHIHADDLAAILTVTVGLSLGEGVYNASDDSEMKMGEYFDLVADRTGLPRPPRVRRSEAAERISPVLLSYMSESRRLVNRRMKAELGIRLRYPTVYQGVPQAAVLRG